MACFSIIPLIANVTIHSKKQLLGGNMTKTISSLSISKRKKYITTCGKTLSLCHEIHICNYNYMDQYRTQIARRKELFQKNENAYLYFSYNLEPGSPVYYFSNGYNGIHIDDVDREDCLFFGIILTTQIIETDLLIIFLMSKMLVKKKIREGTYVYGIHDKTLPGQLAHHEVVWDKRKQLFNDHSEVIKKINEIHSYLTSKEILELHKEAVHHSITASKENV